MRDKRVAIIFNRPLPLTGKVKPYKVTVGRRYEAVLVNPILSLYQVTDDEGTEFNVSMWGQSYNLAYGGPEYTNGGYWHIEPWAAAINCTEQSA